MKTTRLSYRDQLKTPEWKRYSHNLKEEANWTCQECGAKQGSAFNLEVHHVYYMTGFKAWQYPRALVIVVCPQCHNERQGIEQQILSNVAELLRQKSIPEMLDQPIYAFFQPTEFLEA